jgi:hypothetical protein
MAHLIKTTQIYIQQRPYFKFEFSNGVKFIGLWSSLVPTKTGEILPLYVINGHRGINYDIDTEALLLAVNLIALGYPIHEGVFMIPISYDKPTDDCPQEVC